MELKAYREKRKRGETPEPFGDGPPARGAKAAGAWRTFVVQQHAARRMHWDLRLESEGVLASWAVPRGPSFDPKEKRLAVRTEDHPIAYADFEGVIPDGNYGAGAMIVWDRGRYRIVDGRSPLQGIEDGKLDLLLDGHKLEGRFALVRTQREGKRDWLLLRKGDLPADGLAEPTETWPESVLSGLTVDEIREGVTRGEEIAALARELGAVERALDVRELRPMLAGTREKPFSRDGWIFELKHDGVRVLAQRRGESVRLCSRLGRDTTGIYPEITHALSHIPVDDFVLDGEIVALDESGRASFERIQHRFTQTDLTAVEALRTEVPVVLYAFDLLAVGGLDLRRLPLVRRKELLARLVPRRGFIRFSDHVERDGEALFDAVTRQNLEGMIAKRATSTYETARRSESWLKIKVPRTARLVVVGWLAGKGSRSDLGSLMLGWWRGDELVYAGNVGSGLDEKTVSLLLARLREAPLAKPSFSGAPKPPVAGTSYARPEMVAEVRYTEVTSAGLLRQPVFLGLVPDADPATIQAPAEPSGTPEESAPSPAASRPEREPELEVTRPEKIFWPVEGYTKGDLLAYYEAAWPWLEPYLRDRPVVLTRYPDGIEGKSFYQKNAPGFTPKWARHTEIDGTDYFICNDQRTLLYVINSGAIPLHVWSARVGSLDRPDWLILDLDPKEAPFRNVVAIARHIHALLDEIGARHYVKTSGQDGMHVLLPLGATIGHDDARTLGEIIARIVCAELPEIATVTRPRAQRGGKVYVDYLQNGEGKLIAGPLSVRPRAGAPISMPLSWNQVNERLDPSRFTIKTGLAKLEKSGDPLKGVLDGAVDVEAVLTALAVRLERSETRKRRTRA